MSSSSHQQAVCTSHNLQYKKVRKFGEMPAEQEKARPVTASGAALHIRSSLTAFSFQPSASFWPSALHFLRKSDIVKQLAVDTIISEVPEQRLWRQHRPRTIFWRAIALNRINSVFSASRFVFISGLSLLNPYSCPESSPSNPRSLEVRHTLAVFCAHLLLEYSNS
jgi:hypothetical protein